MRNLGIMGGLGAPEILILSLAAILAVFLIISPIMWFQERKKRKYWQAKAEDYEKRLLSKN